MNSDPETVVNSPSDLPPPRQRKGLRSVSPPFSSTPTHRFNYYIALFAAVLFAIYAYRVVCWKVEAGSWWNIALGKKPPAVQNMQGAHANWKAAASGVGSGNTEDVSGDGEVERRINELASVLGLPSKDLAFAIASAVREHIPPASLSSIAAHQTGEAVQYLVDPSGASASDAQTEVGATATRAMEAMASAFEAAVGLDEPPSDVSL